MGRLTKRSNDGNTVWYKSGDLWLEPCEIRSYSDIGAALRRLAYFEDLEERGKILTDEVILKMAEANTRREEQMLALVKKMTPVAVTQEVKHGHWIPTGTSNSTGPIVRCSVCGQYINPSGEAIDLGRQKLEPDFCEKCGSRMDE